MANADVTKHWLEPYGALAATRRICSVTVHEFYLGHVSKMSAKIYNVEEIDFNYYPQATYCLRSRSDWISGY
jgi:hypothetical protein